MENKFYQRGLYLLLGDKNLRNGRIIAKIYDVREGRMIMNILNKPPNEKYNIVDVSKEEIKGIKANNGDLKE